MYSNMCIYSLLRKVVTIIQVTIKIIFKMSDNNIYYLLSTEMAMIDLITCTFVQYVVLEPCAI